jgi:tRNA pseudouridine38-40 synthase
MGQVAHFRTVTTHKPETIRNALNANLPEDVTVLEASFADSNFHAQYSAKRKTYRYTVLNRSARTALERKFCLHSSHKINLRRLKKESRRLVGRHDFRSFAASGSETGPRHGEKLSTIRTIYRLDITRKENFLFFDIEADGFLYKMVRNIVGTLLESASGRRPKGEVSRILKAKDRTRAGITAPACGLCLMHVDY